MPQPRAAQTLWWVITLCVLLAAAVIAVVVVLAGGTPVHGDAARQDTGGGGHSQSKTTTSPTSTATSGVPTTTASPTTTAGGFVQPQPSRAGVFCAALLADQKTPEEPWTGLLATAPDSNPWGAQKIVLPAHPTAAFIEDLAAVRSLANATLVVQAGVAGERLPVPGPHGGLPGRL